MAKRVNIGSRRALGLSQCHLVREAWGLLNQFFEHLRLIKRQRANLLLLETFSKAIPRTAKTLKILLKHL
ncbi:MAG: hypothetical protein CME80_03330 [Halomonas sp.]|nr:hypothetical protein [Halomonas sp.]